MIDITLVSARAGDWKGLYLNHRLYVEGHEITLADFIDAFKTFNTLPSRPDDWHFTSREANDSEQVFIDYRGCMPKELE